MVELQTTCGGLREWPALGTSPTLEAPRCLPCNYSAYASKPAGEMQFNAPEGCPCTPELLCAADQRGVFGSDCSILRANVPGFSTRTYSIHGGAGGLLSKRSPQGCLMPADGALHCRCRAHPQVLPASFLN